MSHIEGDWHRDGAICVRGALKPGDIACAERAIEANLADLSPLAKRASERADGAFVEDFCSWSRIADMERFITTSPVAALAADVMGAHTVRLFHDHVL
ncbi:MAG: phytanoyl-CoA dioxygenase, partial [Ilumatobacteraceae bacterium]